MRNSYIAYILTALYKSWFWIGIWVLFYLRFTNYAGIGILEGVMIVTMIVTEIPTGAIADLLGKKNTLIAAFLFAAIGNVMMGLAQNFQTLIVSVLILTTSASLFSGSLEALVYDSLKEEGKADKFDKKISNIATVNLATVAIASIIGGFLYKLGPGLPFVVCGVIQSIGILVALFLKEPSIDTERFSIKSFIQQNKEGFKELIKTPGIRIKTLYFLSFSVVFVILYQVLNDVLAVEYGMNAQQLGTFVAIIYLTAAIASQFTPLFLRKFKLVSAASIMIIPVIFTLLLSPFITSVFIGGLFWILRSASQRLVDNTTSIFINTNTESKYRATTLSTFNMLQSLPYAMVAFYIGVVMDKISAKNVAGILGIIILAIFLLFNLFFFKNVKPYKESL